VKPHQVDIDELNDLANKLALDGALREQTADVNLRWTAILVQINDVKVVARYSLILLVCSKSAKNFV